VSCNGLIWVAGADNQLTLSVAQRQGILFDLACGTIAMTAE
jgi:hypothetical protein